MGWWYSSHLTTITMDTIPVAMVMKQHLMVRWNWCYDQILFKEDKNGRGIWALLVRGRGSFEKMRKSHREFFHCISQENFDVLHSTSLNFSEKRPRASSPLSISFLTVFFLGVCIRVLLTLGETHEKMSEFSFRAKYPHCFSGWSTASYLAVSIHPE